MLHELEGDAVNFYAVSDGSREMAKSICAQVLGFIDAFRERERELVSECGACTCEACDNVGKLKVKAIVHHGEAAFTRVRHFEKVGGEDVILAHRLLKNTVPGDEYVLLTGAFANIAGGLEGIALEDRMEPCEGIGNVSVKVYYAEPTPSEQREIQASALDKVRMLAKLGSYSVRRMFQPSKEFRHLQEL